MGSLACHECLRLELFCAAHRAGVFGAGALFTAPAFPAQALSAPSIINKVEGDTPRPPVLWPHEAD
jgi:hypothetical protein